MAAGAAGIFSHQEEAAVRWSRAKLSVIAEQLVTPETDTARRGRELAFLQAAYDRLQAELKEAPNAGTARSLRSEQETIAAMIRDRREADIADAAPATAAANTAAAAASTGSSTPVIAPIPRAEPSSGG